MSEPSPTSTEAFNMSMRKFLKQVGVTSQQHIEAVIRNATEKGALDGMDTVPVKMTLTLNGIEGVHEVEGVIDLRGEA